MPGQQLVFVYNVDASPVALLRDLWSGLTTGTTDCHLCDLTFGKLMKDRSWARFVEELPYEVDFQLRSTFRRERPDVEVDAFPAAFLVDGSAVEQVLTADEVNAATDLEALRTLVGDLVEQLVARG